MNCKFIGVVLLVCLIPQNKAQAEIMDRLNGAMRKTVAGVKDTYSEVEGKVSNFYNELKSKFKGNDEKLAENMWRTVNEMYRLREDFNDFREDFRNFQQNNGISELAGEIQDLRYQMSRTNQKQQDLINYYRQNNAIPQQGEEIIRELSYIRRQVQDIKSQQQKTVNCTSTHNKVQVDNYWRPKNTTDWSRKTTTTTTTTPYYWRGSWRYYTTTEKPATDYNEENQSKFPYRLHPLINTNYNEDEGTKDTTTTEVPYWRLKTTERNTKTATSRYWRFTVPQTTLPPIDNRTDNSEEYITPESIIVHRIYPISHTNEKTKPPTTVPPTDNRTDNSEEYITPESIIVHRIHPISHTYEKTKPPTTVPSVETTTDNSQEYTTIRSGSFYPWIHESPKYRIEYRKAENLSPPMGTTESTEHIVTSDDWATYNYDYQ